MIQSLVISMIFLSGACLIFSKFKTLYIFPMKLKFFDLSVTMDWISILFLSLLFFITASVLLFSMSYMSGKVFSKRFFWLILSFVGSMCSMILIPFSLFMLVGWDGLGIFSFLLVCFYKAKSSWAASLKTYLTKRVGDGLFLFFFCIITYKSFYFSDSVFSFWVVFYFFLACFTKSAQIPFSSWLPAAMAAPTPVSSLVHSSTLVTAGIYLLIRTNIEYCKFLVMVMGTMTSLIAALAAIKEFDSKKVVALSTLSNLGMMAIALGKGMMLQSFFHLITHAVAKANLFVSVGWFMLKNSHHQDVRLLKKTLLNNIFLKVNLVLSIFSLSGIIFFSGFFSKESILESYLNSSNLVLKSMFFSIIFFSLIYGFRLFHLLSFNTSYYLKVKLKNNSVVLSVLPLSVLTLFLGKVFKKFFLSLSMSLVLFKLMMYFFMLVSSMYMFCLKKSQSFFLKELFYKKYMGSSFFLKSSGLSSSLFFSLKKIIFKSEFISLQALFFKSKKNSMKFKLLVFMLVLLVMVWENIF